MVFDRTCGSFLLGVPTLHRVFQAARGVDDGDGAVHHGAHLWNSTGFIPGWHQEEIGARDDLLLHLWAEAPVATNAALPTALGPLQHATEVLFTIAHHHQLHVLKTIFIVLHDPMDARSNQVNTFLIGKAADEAQDAGVVVLLQPQLPLQVAFAFRLPGEIGGEFRGDATIPRGIPAAIDTIQNSHQKIALPSDKIMQTKATLGCSDFIRVGRRHRDDAITTLDRSLGEIQRLS